MFFELVPECPARFSIVLLGAVYMWAFEFVEYPTLLKFVVFVFGCYKECFYSISTFEMYLYSLVVVCPFEFLTYSLYVWNHYGIFCCFCCCYFLCLADCTWILVPGWCCSCV